MKPQHPDTWMGRDPPSPWPFLLLEPYAQSKAPLSKLRTVFSALLWKRIVQTQLSQYFPILNTASQAASPAVYLNTQKFLQISTKVSPQSFCPALPADWRTKEKSGCPVLAYTFTGEHLPCGHESHHNGEAVEYLHTSHLLNL